ncbi:hypothetical protein C8R44DRAFT_869864 [Mycena epipterygia]|nr:hypothetical protein C8R44DRAFT_869864 [Mycena epipterygia]
MAQMSATILAITIANWIFNRIYATPSVGEDDLAEDDERVLKDIDFDVETLYEELASSRRMWVAFVWVYKCNSSLVAHSKKLRAWKHQLLLLRLAAVMEHKNV